MTTQGSDTAPDQVARLLALVPYLLARGEVRLDDAAAHFGTDAEQIERDLRLLFMTGLSPGLPGDLIEVDLDALEGDRVIRVDNADYLARPVRFSPAEATSLVVALRTMVDTAPAEAREVIARTLAKLEEAAGHDGEELLRLHVSPTPLETSGVVPVLESAIAHGHQLEISYHVPSRDQQSTRVVDPRGLSRVEDVLYLDAWCHTAVGDRAFRVDRIVAATELDSPVADPGARPRDLAGGWFADAETTPVTLRLAPPARWVVEYYPVTGQRPGPDDTVDVDLEVASEEWVTSLLLRLAPHATLLAPAAYADSFTAVARAALSHYVHDDGVDSGTTTAAPPTHPHE
ncbi:protein pafC [Nocardioides flavus (ex Wang et al. 2016)]|uniref:Protein pafC n=1 Tax=Nocardioides flavus (ex Wang et al. 2016) TaxID=2058780 RepID=A0ABQ3HNV9_9ACTN|nr:WYL domain-containing protein [Nocardioides flavus (ex Wang et al. 2016)]GHE18640.1 protein pafC [Nocardioides flavus (ex Wang et al. 2016)]